MPKTNDNIKLDFLRLQGRCWLSLRARTLLDKLRICLQILNKLHNDILSFR